MFIKTINLTNIPITEIMMVNNKNHPMEGKHEKFFAAWFNL